MRHSPIADSPARLVAPALAVEALLNPSPAYVAFDAWVSEACERLVDRWRHKAAPNARRSSAPAAGDR